MNSKNLDHCPTCIWDTKLKSSVISNAIRDCLSFLGTISALSLYRSSNILRSLPKPGFQYPFIPSYSLNRTLSETINPQIFCEM